MGWKRNEALDEAETALIAAANRVRGSLEAELESLRRSDPHSAKRFLASWNPNWAKKYLHNAEAKVRKWRRFFPHLAGVRQAYEIGVGPGYLFRLLMDVYGVQLSGCDVEPGHTLVFEALRQELGIAHLVETHRVRPRREIPITEGSEAMLAFLTSFCETYSVADYRWLLDHCRERLSGDKQVLILFNARCFEVDGVQQFFQRNAEFPLLGEHQAASKPHAAAFCRVRLA